MKGILLAGGTGTRLYPLTRSVSKQLLPVYDKPMVYYPLSTLMLAGIRDIMIITTPEDAANYRSLLGDGEQWGLSLHYTVQPRPDGIAQAFILARDFIGDEGCALMLGDNIFYGHGLVDLMNSANAVTKGGSIFAYKVKTPERYGAVEFGADGKVVSIEEKPESPRSSWAITGLYFFDNDVVEIAKTLKPSKRGELEIVDVHAAYQARGDLRVELMGRGYSWFDTGVHGDLLGAGQFIETIQTRQGLAIACPEEIACHKGWIDEETVLKLAKELSKNEYGVYLHDMIMEERLHKGKG